MIDCYQKVVLVPESADANRQETETGAYEMWTTLLKYLVW